MSPTIFIFMAMCYTAACMAIGVALGMEWGSQDKSAMIREEAVKAGVGFWVCNPGTGRTRFAWASEMNAEPKQEDAT